MSVQFDRKQIPVSHCETSPIAESELGRIHPVISTALSLGHFEKSESQLPPAVLAAFAWHSFSRGKERLFSVLILPAIAASLKSKSSPEKNALLTQVVFCLSILEKKHVITDWDSPETLLYRAALHLAAKDKKSCRNLIQKYFLTTFFSLHPTDKQNLHGRISKMQESCPLSVKPLLTQLLSAYTSKVKE